MPYQVIITDIARIDIQDAYDYYEAKKVRLGEDFLQALINKMDRLKKWPHHYGFIDRRSVLRDVFVDGFPYIIVFEIMGSDVVVHSVFNTHRER